jgi:hypothetical protein
MSTRAEYWIHSEPVYGDAFDVCGPHETAGEAKAAFTLANNKA